MFLLPFFQQTHASTRVVLLKVIESGLNYGVSTITTSITIEQLESGNFEQADAHVVDISYQHSARQLFEVPQTDDGYQRSTICMLQEEDERITNEVICSDNMLLLNETCPSYHDQDYVEKIKEFQFYVGTVKKIVRPGCSPEMLNVALSSLSFLVKALSHMSSKL